MQSNAARRADALLKYNGVPREGVASNFSPTPLTAWKLALHSGWPGRTGTQSTNECSAVNYFRVAVPRSDGGFTVAEDGSVSLAVVRTFLQLIQVSTPERLDFFSIGEQQTGAGIIEQMGVIAKFGTVLIPFSASPTGNLVTALGHRAVAGDRVALLPLSGLSLPGGVTEGGVYFVRDASLTADTMTVSATPGGAAVVISSFGEGQLAVLGGPLIEGSYQDVELQTTTALLVD